MFKKILFSSITFICFFVILIFVDASITYFKKHSSIVRNDALLSYTLNPAFVSGKVHINQKYARGRDFLIKKNANCTRIIALGDSCTFGWGVTDNATFPHQLEKLLNEARLSQAYEVINFGTPGYSSLEVLYMLKNYIYKFSPDIIIVMIGWNDLQEKGLIPFSWRKNRLFFRLNSLINKSVLITSFKESVVKAKVAWLRRHISANTVIVQDKQISIDNAGFTEPDIKEISYIPLDAFGENLRDIALFCKNRGIKLFVLVPPCGFEPNDFLSLNLASIPRQYWDESVASTSEMYKNVILFSRYAQKVCDVSKQNNILLIDIYREFLRLPLNERANLFDNIVKDWIHPNQLGNLLMAKTVFSVLKDE